MSVDYFASGGGGEEFGADGSRDDYGMAEGFFVAGHDDLVRGAAGAERADELAYGRGPDERMIDGIDHEGGACWDLL